MARESVGRKRLPPLLHQKNTKETSTLRWGRMAQPSRMEICCTILMPVCRACQLFLLWQTALRKGRSAGMPRAEATTLKARAVVLRTYLANQIESVRLTKLMLAR